MSNRATKAAHENTPRTAQHNHHNAQQGQCMACQTRHAAQPERPSAAQQGLHIQRSARQTRNRARLQWRVLWAMLALAVLTCVLAGCVDPPDVTELQLSAPKLRGQQMALVVQNRDGTYTTHTVELSEGIRTGADVLGLLAEQQRMSSVLSGSWLQDVADLHPDAAAHEYIAVYTSRRSDWSTQAGVPTVAMDDLTLGYANVGMQELLVPAGTVLYMQLEVW